MPSRRSSRKREAPPPSEEELQRRHARWIVGLATVERVCKTALIGGFSLACVYTGVYLPIQASHGETTTIHVIQNFVTDIKMSVALAWGAAGAGIAYGHIQRRKRIRERTEKDARIAHLERQVDPNRSSSGLTPEGENQGGGLTT